MTFMHIGAGTAIANIPIFVTLNPSTYCWATDGYSAEATINARSSGDVTCRQNGITNVIYDWIDPKSAAPGSPSYQIKRGFASTINVPNFNTDPGYGPFQNVWQNVGTGAFWGMVYTGTGTGYAQATFTVSIRQGIGTVDNEVLYPTLDTAFWSIRTTLT